MSTACALSAKHGEVGWFWIKFNAQPPIILLGDCTVVTSAYAAIALGVFLASRKEIKLWTELYQAAKTDEVNLPD